MRLPYALGKADDSCASRVKSVLVDKLESDAPPTISIGLDAWTAHHHGYMGMNAHYLTNDWERIIFNLACTPFDESHTAEHIYEVLHFEVLDWGIMAKTGLCLRDNAFNMVSEYEPKILG